jgi:hypothetical protein
VTSAAYSEDPGSPAERDWESVTSAAYSEDPGSPTAENYQEDPGESVTNAAYSEDPGSPTAENYQEDPGESVTNAAYSEDPGSPATPEGYGEVWDESSGPVTYSEDPGSPEVASPIFGRHQSAQRATSYTTLENDLEPIEAITLPAGFRTGVWLDVGGMHLNANRMDHVAKLRALSIKDACVMINADQARTFGYGSVSKPVLGSLAPLLRSAEIALTLTSWLRPDRTFIDALVSDLPAYAQSLQAKAIEFDVEAPWVRETPTGFANHTEAAEHLFRGLEAARRGGLEVSVTCWVDALTSDRMLRLLQLTDVVVPQAYSDNPAGAAPAVQQSHRVGGVYGPGGLQTRAVDRLDAGLSASGSKDVIMGLAAYARDRWSGHRPDAILEMEANTSVTLAARRVKGVRYWSWKWIAGKDGRGGTPANSYAERFLTALGSGKAPADPPPAVAPSAAPGQ